MDGWIRDLVLIVATQTLVLLNRFVASLGFAVLFESFLR